MDSEREALFGLHFERHVKRSKWSSIRVARELGPEKEVSVSDSQYRVPTQLYSISSHIELYSCYFVLIAIWYVHPLRLGICNLLPCLIVATPHHTDARTLSTGTSKSATTLPSTRCMRTILLFFHHICRRVSPLVAYIPFSSIP